MILLTVYYFACIKVRRLIDFIGNFFTDDGGEGGGAATSGRRRLNDNPFVSTRRSQSVKRGSIMRAVKNSLAPQDFRRRLQVESEPLLTLEVNNLLSLTFDFDFGGESKSLLFGALFSFDSGNGAEDDIKIMLQSFLNETIGDTNAVEGGNLRGFSFAEKAAGKNNCQPRSIEFISFQLTAHFLFIMKNLFKVSPSLL